MEIFRTQIILLLALLFCSVWLSGTWAAGAVIYVDGNAPNDPGVGNPDISDPMESGTAEHPYDSIQEAIDTAVNGDTVEVQPGRYFEHIQFNGKNITLRSSNPEDWSVVRATVIDAQRLGRPVTFSGSETNLCVLKGFTVTGGLVTEPYGQGGGIYGNRSKARIHRCIVEGNETRGIEGDGGGISRMAAEISGCIIQNNIASGIGGGVCEGLLKDCIIRNNRALRGGGLAIVGGPFVNCLIAQNTSIENAGGVYCFQGELVHCTIVDNVAGVEGGGVEVWPMFSPPRIVNCILWGNRGHVYGDQTDQIRLYSAEAKVTVQNSCIQGTNPYSGVNGNIPTEPNFVNPAGGDYHLTAGSKCIDSAPFLSDLPRDLQGVYRPIDGDGDGTAGYDIGAYEYIEPGKTYLGVSKTTLKFESYLDGVGPQDQILAIQNLGPAEMAWQLEGDCPWLRIQETQGAVPALSNHDIQIGVEPGTLPWGSYSCDLIVSSPHALNDSMTVHVEFHIIGPRVQPMSIWNWFEIRLGQGNPESQNLWIQNTGGGILNWFIDPYPSCTWLTVHPVAGSLSAGQLDTLRMDVDVTGLGGGLYSCPLMVRAPGAEVESKVADVYLKIIGPIVEVSANSLLFETMPGGRPADQTLTVRNAGGGILNWTAAVQPEVSWFAVQPAAGSLPDSETQEIIASITSGGLARGTYTCTLSVSASDADNPPQTVAIRLEVGTDLATGYGGGDGTQDNPFQIWTVGHFKNLSARSADWGKHFVLMADLDLSGVVLKPVGDRTTTFVGRFDGRGHRIYNLVQNIQNSLRNFNIGLFGNVGTGGRISNLGLENADVSGAREVGGLAGYNQGSISGCYVTGKVSPNQSETGGMVGTNTGSVANCYAKVSTTGGGLVGYNNTGTIANCYSIHSGNRGLVGASNQGSITSGFWGNTLEPLRMKCTYTVAGWDFVGETANGMADLWRICEDGVDYPQLAWEFSRTGDFACPDGTEMADLLELAGQWLKMSTDPIGMADGNRDGRVNFEDFGLLGDHWLYRRVPNLVLHMPLDGDYLSSVGGYWGEPHGDPEFVPEAEARVGSGAIELDEDDLVVAEGFKGIPGSQARTCMAWVKTTDLSGPLITWGDQFLNGGQWQIGIRGGRLTLDINGADLSTPLPIHSGQWVHVAVVLPDRTNRLEDVRLYVDGVVEDHPILNLWSSSVRINTLVVQDLCIGKPRPNSIGYTGLIDDIRVYDWAMSRKEIAAVTGLFGADAGKDRRLDLQTESSLTLEGALYNASDSATVIWEKVSGPGGTVIGNPTARTTGVEFSREGDYVFRLTATDGETAAQDEVAVTVTNGEVGYWRFDGNLLDLFGHHGGANGIPLYVGQDQAQIGSGALLLDGKSSVGINTFKGITGARARTCAAWIQTTSTMAPIIYWGDKNTTGGSWDMRVNSSGQLRIQSVGGAGANSVSEVNTGQWVHVAAVLPEGGNNADDVLLYVNGVLETGGVLTAGTINTKVLSPMRIGADETGKYFTGLIDDVRVYDRALTAEEIVAAMEQ